MTEHDGIDRGGIEREVRPVQQPQWLVTLEQPEVHQDTAAVMLDEEP